MLLIALHLAVTAAYAGVLWLVELALYPQFARVPAAAFPAYHAEHCRRLGWVVGPLFVVEGATALLLAWQLWAAQPLLQAISVGLFLLGHGITFAIFIPLHRQLARGPVTCKDLARAVQLNWLRVIVASVRVVVVIAILVVAASEAPI